MDFIYKHHPNAIITNITQDEHGCETITWIDNVMLRIEYKSEKKQPACSHDQTPLQVNPIEQPSEVTPTDCPIDWSKNEGTYFTLMTPYYHNIMTFRDGYMHMKNAQGEVIISKKM